MSATTLIEQARELGATVLETHGAIVIIVASTGVDGAELVPIKRAAAIAATTPRVVTEAIRAGDLPAFGRQRDRSVRRADLDMWIETRRAPVVRVEADHESRIEQRMKRRARGGSR